MQVFWSDKVELSSSRQLADELDCLKDPAPETMAVMPGPVRARTTLATLNVETKETATDREDASEHSCHRSDQPANHDDHRDGVGASSTAPAAYP